MFADNVDIFKNSLKPYVDYVRDRRHGFVTATLSAGSRFEYSVYLPDREVLRAEDFSDDDCKAMAVAKVPDEYAHLDAEFGDWKA